MSLITIYTITALFLYTGILNNSIWKKARKLSNKFSMKCCFQLKDWSTPPHEQGSLGMNKSRYKMYAVNINIKASVIYIPTRCVFLKSKRAAVLNSIAG